MTFTGIISMKPTAFRSYALTAAAALVFGAAAVTGQINGTLSGPVVGYFFSAPDRTIRPLQGIVGSATVGNPVNVGFSISQALTLDGRHFLVSSDSSPSLLNLNLETAPASASALPLAASPAVAAAGAGGTAAAFYYRGKGA